MMPFTGRGPSALSAALGARCPRCGVGALFAGVLEVRPACDHCGLDLRAHDAGDGPAVFAIFLVGAVMVGAALWLETRVAPPLWLHAVIWTPTTLALSILVMRPIKAFLVAQAFAKRRDRFGG